MRSQKKSFKTKKYRGGKTINEHIYDRILLIWNKILTSYRWVCEYFTKKTGRHPNENEEMTLWNMSVDLYLNQHKNLPTDALQTDAINKFVQNLKNTPTEDFMEKRPSFNSPYSRRFQTG